MHRYNFVFLRSEKLKYLRTMQTKDVALVLSSGSSRGLAHIGAIEALEERGYHITSVAGCSMGAIVGGMFAAGKLPEIKAFFLDINRRKMLRLTDFSVSINHLIKGERIMSAFGKMIPNLTIEELKIPLALIATDVSKGEERVFTSGNLNQLIRASMSLPAILKPVRYNGMLLMDGGITNPLPLNRVQRSGHDLLVSLNVNAPFEAEELTSSRPNNVPPMLEKILNKGEKLTEVNYVSIISRITDIMITQNTELITQLYPPDMTINVAKNHFGSYDYDRAEEIINYGHDLMIKEIDRFEGIS